MKLRDGTLTISREISTLDEAVIEFTNVLDSCEIDYVIVSGYVAILTGRSRATEYVDIVIEPLSEGETQEFVDELEHAGYWGMAMPLDETYSLLDDGDRIRIAEEGEMYPNFEVWFASNTVEREALATALTAELDGNTISISPIELQIAYKLQLAQHAGSLTGKDFEDALHLYLTFEEQLNKDRLVGYVRDFGVQEYYDELRGA